MLNVVGAPYKLADQITLDLISRPYLLYNVYTLESVSASITPVEAPKAQSIAVTVATVMLVIFGLILLIDTPSLLRDARRLNDNLGAKRNSMLKLVRSRKYSYIMTQDVLKPGKSTYM